MAQNDPNFLLSEEDEEVVFVQKKKSKVHDHCTVTNPDPAGKKKLQCNYCPKTYTYTDGNTTSILQHFRTAHRDIPALVHDFPATPAKSAAKQKRENAQASVVESVENMKSMHPEHRVAKKITDCLSDYCSLNNRTLDMVNDVGLIRVMAAANPRYQFYSRTHMTKKILPMRYAAAVRSMRTVIDVQPGGWFTSDLWSTENSPDEFLALNFHCLDDHFKYWMFTVGLQAFDDRKTATAIFSEWVKTWIEWGFLAINHGVPVTILHNGTEVVNKAAYSGWERIYGVVCDNGPNIQASCDFLFQETLDDSPPCLAHTVQLVVEDSIDAQRAVIDLMAVGRNFVNFINKSKPAKNFLLNCQREQGIQVPLTVVRCVEPRWDSELAMLERLVKLKPYARELAEHADFHNKCTLFTPNQWNLAGGLITLLSPVRVLTKFTQERPPRPGFAGFEIARCEHELSTVPVNGLGTTKETMLNAYSNRLTEYKGSKPYFMASLLDINMKGCHLNPGEKVIAYDTLKRDIGAHITRTRPAPPPAVPILQPAQQTGPAAARDVTFLQQLLTQNEEEEEAFDVPLDDAVLEAQRELNIYRAIPRDINLTTNICDFWRPKTHIPHIRAVAQKYLAFPVGETDVERVFSKTGVVYCPRRKRLLPFNCKMMLVTNSALRAFNFLLDGDVKLQIPDFIVHEKDLLQGEVHEETDSDENL